MARIEDFKAFLQAAHARQACVITELVVNSSHVRSAYVVPGSAQFARQPRSGTSGTSGATRTTSTQGVRIIFIDTEMSNWSWDPISKTYYWHRFFSHQPDLNYDNPAVKEAVWEVMKFWLDIGVDGFRLDAVPYLVEREAGLRAKTCRRRTYQSSGNCCARLDDAYPGKNAAGGRSICGLLLTCAITSARARATNSTCTFHFPLMPRMFMAVKLEDRKLHHRHPGADSSDSRQLPVVRVSSQS